MSDTTATSATVKDSSLSWISVLNAIANHAELSDEAVSYAMDSIMGGEATAAQIAAFIFGMRVKGITPQELDAAAASMLSFAQPAPIPHPEGAVDIVGTGGDGAHTVNVSTMAGLVVASTGVTVVKHGNRAASSKCGGADMLEALGIQIEQDPETVAHNAAEHHFAFMFAKAYHPAMRFAGPVRSELKVPTLFNLLGPMTNPARPRNGLIGCAFPEMSETMAQAFARRGDSVLVVRGQDGLDEISVSAPTDCFVVANGEVHRAVIDPRELGLELFPRDALRGGDPEFNATVARALFAGTADPAVRTAVVLNAAAALVAVHGLGGRSLTDALRDEMKVVSDALDAGKPRELVEVLTSAQ